MMLTPSLCTGPEKTWCCKLVVIPRCGMGSHLVGDRVKQELGDRRGAQSHAWYFGSRKFMS